MKILSVTTQFITINNMVEHVSKTLFKNRPYIEDRFDVFHTFSVETEVIEHLKRPHHRAIVTVKTSMGTYVKTFKGS
jgi:hypothetical protein